MDLTPYVAALRDDLAAAAAVGDEATSRAGNSLAAALEPAVRLALMNALSDLAGEVSEALGDRSVSLRLSGRQVDVVVDRDPSSAEGADGRDGFFAGPASSPFAGTPSGGSGGPHRPTPPPPGPGFGGGEGTGGGFGGFGGFGGRGGPDVGDISRMTLRLVDQIKGQAERAAAAQGMSLNSWIAQAVQGALHQHGRRGGWGGGDRGDWGDWGGTSGGDSGSGWDAGWSGDRGSSTGPSTGSSTPTDPTPGSGSPGPEAPRKDDGDEGSGGGVDGWVRG